jgi:hypothetical protein
MSKASIELLYLDGCPNHKMTLRDLDEIMRQEGLDGRVTLVRVESEDDAKRLRFSGSPTLRIKGTDIEQSARESEDFGIGCRIQSRARFLVLHPGRC